MLKLVKDFIYDIISKNNTIGAVLLETIFRRAIFSVIFPDSNVYRFS